MHASAAFPGSWCPMGSPCLRRSCRSSIEWCPRGRSRRLTGTVRRSSQPGPCKPRVGSTRRSRTCLGSPARSPRWCRSSVLRTAGPGDCTKETLGRDSASTNRNRSHCSPGRSNPHREGTRRRRPHNRRAPCTPTHSRTRQRRRRGRARRRSSRRASCLGSRGVGCRGTPDRWRRTPRHPRAPRPLLQSPRVWSRRRAGNSRRAESPSTGAGMGPRAPSKIVSSPPRQTGRLSAVCKPR